MFILKLQRHIQKELDKINVEVSFLMVISNYATVGDSYQLYIIRGSSSDAVVSSNYHMLVTSGCSLYGILWNEMAHQMRCWTSDVV